jgi:hypothetical protein
MQRVLTRTLLVFVPALLSALVLWVPAGTADVGLQSAALSCNDGTQLTAALDPLGVMALSDAVAAVGLYPAGDPPLACSLATSTASSTDPNGPKDFAVGGGQFMSNTCGLVNFSLSAHVANDAPPLPGQAGVGGTYNNSTGAMSPCGEGSFTAKVDCVVVSGNQVQFTALVTHAKGAPFFGTPGDEVAIAARDDTPDQLTFEGGFFTSGPCDFSVAQSFLVPITRGNISVHDA